jgi:hypothetical protein
MALLLLHSSSRPHALLALPLVIVVSDISQRSAPVRVVNHFISNLSACGRRKMRASGGPQIEEGGLQLIHPIAITTRSGSLLENRLRDPDFLRLMQKECARAQLLCKLGQCN